MTSKNVSRSSRRRLLLSVVGPLGLLGLAPAQSNQYTLAQFTMTVANSGVALWSTTDGESKPWSFVGPQWSNSSITLGGVDTTTNTGAELVFTTSGALGFKFRPYYSAGKMTYSYQSIVSVNTNTAIPAPGDTVSVWLSATGTGASNFSTTSPSVGFGVAATCGFNATGTALVEFLGDTLYSNNNVVNWGSGFNTSTVTNSSTTLNTTYDYSITGAINKAVGNKGKVPGDPNNDILLVTNDTLAPLNLALGAIPFVGAKLSVPDLTTSSGSVGTDQSISGSKYSPFIDFSTSLTKILLSALGQSNSTSKGQNFGLGEILDGSLPIYIPDTGTNFTVTWDICKAFADLNFGVGENISLAPAYTYDLQVWNDVTTNGKVTSSRIPATLANGKWSFTFPSKGTVRFVPKATQTFTVTNKFSWGIGGDIGITPIKLTAKGTIASSTVDWTFDPATEEYTGDSTWPITTQTVADTPPNNVGAPAAGQVISLQARDDSHLPPKLQWAGTNAVGPQDFIVLNANQSDGERSYATFSLIPPQGYQMFIDLAGTMTADPAFKVSATVNPAASASTKTPLAFGGDSYDVRGGTVNFQIPQTYLKPGVYSVNVSLTGQTKGSPKPTTKSYAVPLYVVNPTPLFATDIFSGSDRDPTEEVHQGTVGKDQTYWFGITTGFAANTSCVINDGQFVLPTQVQGWSPTNGGGAVGVTIPTRISNMLVGTSAKIQFANTNVNVPAGAATQLVPAKTLSNAVMLPFPAPSLSISTVSLGSTAQTVSRITDIGASQTLTITGSGFVAGTKASLKAANGAAVGLKTIYSSLSQIKVIIPRSNITDAEDAGAQTLALTLTSPTILAPADATHKAVTSAPVATTNLLIGYPVPTIKGNPKVGPFAANAAATVEIPFLGVFKSTTVTVSGQKVPCNVMASTSAGSMEKVVRLSIPATLVKPGACAITVVNQQNQVSAPIQLPIFHPTPVITNEGFYPELTTLYPHTYQLKVQASNASPDTVLQILSKGKVIWSAPYKPSLLIYTSVPSNTKLQSVTFTPGGSYSMQLVSPFEVAPSNPVNFSWPTG